MHRGSSPFGRACASIMNSHGRQVYFIMSCKAYLILIIKQVETEGEVELPPSLRNNVVVLDAPNASGTTTKVYVMGVSHVSKIQAEQV